MGICWTNIINSMTFIVSIGCWQNLQTYCFVCQSRYKVNSWHAPLMDTYYKWSCPSQGYLHFKGSCLELLMSWPLSWRETSSRFFKPHLSRCKPVISGQWLADTAWIEAAGMVFIITFLSLTGSKNKYFLIIWNIFFSSGEKLVTSFPH